MLALGGIAYLIGCGILLLPGVEPGGPALPFVVARFFQGVGIAGALPAAMSLVPHLVPPHRRGIGLAFVGSAHNLTLVAMPPLSLAVLAISSLRGVALAMTVVVARRAGRRVRDSLPLPGYPRRRDALRTRHDTRRPGGSAWPCDEAGSRSSRSSCCSSPIGAW